jgi:hypothetical protein
LQRHLPVAVREYLLQAGRAAAAQKYLAADHVVVAVVRVFDAVDFSIGAVFVGDLYQPVAVVPGVFRIGAIARLGALEQVAFFVVRVSRGPFIRSKHAILCLL